MPANVIMVHDDPSSSRKRQRPSDWPGITQSHSETQIGLWTELENTSYEILITRVRFPPGRPNGVALARMARLKRPGIKVLFTAAAENIEYTEGLGEFIAAPIDIPELVAMVAKLAIS